LTQAETSLVVPIEPLGRRNSLGELAYERLKDSIVGGQFQPGAKLTVRSVAQALGVSTTPARDAINRLIADGALINRGPKTVVVPELTMTALNEVTKIRLNLEGQAAFESAQFVTDEDVWFLEEVQSRLNDALDSARYADVLKLNRTFHFRIYERSGMPRLVAIIESLWLRIGPFLNRLYPEYAISKRGVANHQWAIRGLQDRDGLTVRAAIENDLRDGYRRLSKMVRSEGSDGE
jgi:DNA-binding GntR family transcriptional regulator